MEAHNAHRAYFRYYWVHLERQHQEHECLGLVLGNDMREMVEKSIQLNRELISLLEKALESNKAIKIG